MQEQQKKPLNKNRTQRKMLNRWENEGGAIASGESDAFVPDNHFHQLNDAKNYNRHKLTHKG